MARSEVVAEDPQTLKRIMEQAEPSQSHVGRMMDAGRSHTQPFAGSAPKTHSVTRKEHRRLLQLQRDYQASWEVAADRRLLLPELRTMAPSFTKTADEGRTYFSGTKISGAGYNTIVGMIPTVDSIRRIADDDELISSFRPYRIDALRAARSAEATKECTPHPDDARHLEPTLFALASNRLIDFDAIPDDVVEAHWPTACVFAATTVQEEEVAAATQLTTASGEAHRALNSKSPRSALVTGTSSFLVVQRFKSPKKMPGMRQPAIGYYHQRYTQVEPRVVGGYMSPRESAAPQKRVPNDDLSMNVDFSTDFTSRATPVVQRMADSTREFACSVAAVSVSPRDPSPPKVLGSHMFLSKTGRSLTANCSPAKDLDYYPYADVRSTVKRSKCPVKFDVALTERRHDGVVPSAVVGMYELGGDIAQNPHRVVCMDRESGRDTHWVNKKPAFQSSPDLLDADAAIKAVRPRIRVVHMAQQVPEDHVESQKKAPKMTVSTERDPNFQVGAFGSCTGRRVPKFEKMVGRSESVGAVLHEAPENVERTLVTKRTPCAVIHPKAPGHAPLHRTNLTEIGEIPNLTLVKPRTSRTTDFGTISRVQALPLMTRDLWYNTDKRSLVESRVRGDPMIQSHVSREKRANLFSTSGCGANNVYNVCFPYRCKLVPLFEKQTTKETQFCGHRLQSERWQRKNPKAPGPGHYTVSYRLVE